MHGEIITIGTELTSGRTLDLNAWYAAGRLTASGLQVTRITSVGDDYNLVSQALTNALQTSRFIIVTGGLGSTDDDMTSEIVAETLKRPLCLDNQMFQLINKHVQTRGIKMTPSLEKMAWMPDGSRMINPEGNACGFFLQERDVRLYFLPGVPEQMRYLTDRFVIPELLRFYKTLPVIRQRILKLYGLNEPDIAETLKELHGKTGDVVLGFYPDAPENHITLSLRGESESTVTQELAGVERQVRQMIGPFVFATANEKMEEVVGRMLLDKGLTLATGESCTGGMIGNRLTNVSGSSQYFKGGTIVYSNAAKQALLGVKAETIERYGAVSEPTVKEMAAGTRARLCTDLGVAVSGIAGPGGGSREKPVGTVCVGLATEGPIFTGQYRFWGARQQVKANACIMAMDWVRRYLNGDPFLPGI
jgi:nicotinamide-nucleotide amidase